VLIADDGEILYKWKSRHLPLGIFDSDSFSSATEIFNFKQACQLYLFSDGLPEAESPNGEQFGYARIDALLQATTAAQRFDNLFGEFEAHLCGEAAHDDVSLAMVSVAPRSDTRVLDSSINDAQWILPESSWRFAISLGSDQLKRLKVIPLLRDIICKINADYEQQASLFLILSELLNNALDHGVLQLDSRTKQGADGFEDYLELRAARLRELKNGKIDLEIEKIVVDGKDGLKIRIVDSGDGFDYEEFQTDALSQHNQAQHGRGLAIVSKLAYKLTYAQRGSDVVAYYIFS
jgi:anti-sigma regulatory factor (Ser/Thr protein kinase)